MLKDICNSELIKLMVALGKQDISRSKNVKCFS